MEGIIKECESPYTSPVVLIPKTNGTFGLCIDYKKLNRIIISDIYQLLRMDDLLHQAKPTSFMSKFDLWAGYHQVKMHSEDKDKKAFVCPFKICHYLRMPYGLRNVLGIFMLWKTFRHYLSRWYNHFTRNFWQNILDFPAAFETHFSNLK